MIILLNRMKLIARTFSVCLVALSAMSCAKAPAPPKAEEPAPPASTASSAPAPIDATATIPPPTADEVRAKLDLIFEGAVTPDAGRAPYYLAGDFNGDGSQDLAIAVQPLETRLKDLNNEVANWILGDPVQAELPDPGKSVQQLPESKPVHIERTDSQLLAVIHGHGASGWRDPLARQTYLLRNAIGSSVSSQPAEEMAEAVRTRARKPVIYANRAKTANVIKQKLRGSSGFLYYTGAKYAWYELK